ncbi:hypothetical protein ACFWIW_35790 [Amycolatopsis sp. NPDC058340]|uniref:hypothetical protein n=1 Tax=Amycolatopsis sp. NPDC058340 TaxID=3346453 RepID=UPI0036672B2E
MCDDTERPWTMKIPVRELGKWSRGVVTTVKGALVVSTGTGTQRVEIYTLLRAN